MRYAFITLGSVCNPKIRIKLYNRLKEIGFTIPSIIDKSAIIAKECEIGEGTYIGKRAIVNTGAKIGKNTIINTGTIV